MIPKTIMPYFDTTYQKMDSENTQIEEILTCCSSHDFEISAVGEIKNSIFSKMYLLPENGKIALDARCKKCGKEIPAFDSDYNDYVCCEKKIHHGSTAAKPIKCKKCGDNNFSVGLRYEYPDIQELTNLGIVEADTAFTWVWVTLKSNRCGTRYKNFIDFEME